MSGVPEMCEQQCFMVLSDDPCDECLATYEYWCEVEDSGMEEENE